MGASLALLLLSFLAACGQDRPLARDSTRDIAPVPVQQVAQAPITVGHPDSIAIAVCDSVAKAWAKMEFTHVARADTTVKPINRNATDQRQPDEVLPLTPACMVTAESDSGATVAARSDTTSGGWVDLSMISSDGPDGGSRTIQRGLVRCQDRWSQDGGDDSDSTYVASKATSEELICWRHPRAIVPSDTGVKRGN